MLGAGADTTTPSRAPLPQKRLVAKGGRTLGASGGAGGQNVEARSAAARAAEVGFLPFLLPQYLSLVNVLHFKGFSVILTI